MLAAAEHFVDMVEVVIWSHERMRKLLGQYTGNRNDTDGVMGWAR